MSEERRKHTEAHRPPSPGYAPYYPAPPLPAGYPYGYYPQATGQLVPYGYNQPYFTPVNSQNYFSAAGNYGGYGHPALVQQQMYGSIPPPPPADVGARAPAVATPVAKERQGAEEGPISRDKCNAVWNPSSDRDLTIHFEVDVEEDTQSNVNEFVQLVRMGSFVKADQYFREALAENLEQVPVVLEYANMLVERGSYRELFEMVDMEAFTANCAMLTARDLKSGHADEINLLLVLHLARIASDPNLPLAHTAIQIASQFLRSRDDEAYTAVTSTEIQVLCRCLVLGNWVAGHSNLVLPSDLAFENRWKNWPHLYQTLVDESRFWDLSDLIIASVAVFGAWKTCENIFEKNSLLAGLEKFADDWDQMEHDQSRDACLLGILMCFGRTILGIFVNDNVLGTASTFLFDKARSVARSIRETNPPYMKSRPYIEWMLAEEEYTRVVGRPSERKTTATTYLSPRYFEQFPGKTMWSDVLPIYAPLGSENPGWPVKSASSEEPEADNVITLALRMSNELGDYRAQTWCLGEMICRSPEPQALFAKLEHLQLSVMGSLLGLLKTRLSKYLIVADETSREALYRDLLELDPRLHVWRNFSEPVIEWFQRRILHALLLSSGHSPDQTRNVAAQAAALSPFLPVDFFTGPAVQNEPPMPGPAGMAPFNAETQGIRPRDAAIDSGWSTVAGQDIYAPPDYGLPPHLQQYLYRSGTPPPKTPPPAPRTPSLAPTPPPDPELQAMRAQLAQINLEQSRKEAMEKQKELERRIRQEAEDASNRRMEAMKMAQEEAKKEIELAKLAAERLAQDRLEAKLKAEKEQQAMHKEALARAERDARDRVEAEMKAEKERQAIHKEVIARAERDARERFEAEMKAAEEQKKREAEMMAAAEAKAMAKVEAAMKAEAQARAAAQAKAAEQEEWMRAVREEAQVSAEIAARRKLEREAEERAMVDERIAREESLKQKTRDELREELKKEVKEEIRIETEAQRRAEKDEDMGGTKAESTDSKEHQQGHDSSQEAVALDGNPDTPGT